MLSNEDNTPYFSQKVYTDIISKSSVSLNNKDVEMYLETDTNDPTQVEYAKLILDILKKYENVKHTND